MSSAHQHEHAGDPCGRRRERHVRGDLDRVVRVEPDQEQAHERQVERAEMRLGTGSGAALRERHRCNRSFVALR